MATYSSSGVYINEIDRSTYIAGVASTVANTVLRNTYKGREFERKLITNENELIDEYGIPIDKVYDANGEPTSIADNYQDMLSALGYLNSGNTLYCVRTMPASATFAGTMLDNTDSFNQFTDSDALTLQTETYTGGDISDPDDFSPEVISSMGTDQIWMIAKDRGHWGNNVRVALVDLDTQTQILSGGMTSWEGSDVYNTVYNLDDQISSDHNFLVLVQEKPQRGDTWSLRESWNVSLDEDATDDQGQTMFVEDVINRQSRYIRIAVADSVRNSIVPNEWATEEFNRFGGGADHQGDSLEDAAIIEGFELSEDPKEVDVNLFIDSNKSETVKMSIVELCRSRKDAMLIADVKYEHVINNKGNETTDIRNWRKGNTSPNFNVNTSYAALYANWLEVYDKYNKKYRWIPASGHMAGIYAYNDQVTDPWFAPAGLNRGMLTGVRRLAWNPNKAKRDRLYISGINPIVSFSGKGKVVWGQKTMLDENSAFNRVNVRRLFMTIEQSIADSAEYFVFQPNDRDTRRRFVGMVDPFLSDVKARRGVYDYLVVCNESNNTPERIDRNEMWVDIYIKPTRSAEFIVVNFIATRTGVDFTEV